MSFLKYYSENNIYEMHNEGGGNGFFFIKEDTDKNHICMNYLSEHISVAEGGNDLFDVFQDDAPDPVIEMFKNIITKNQLKLYMIVENMNKLDDHCISMANDDMWCREYELEGFKHHKDSTYLTIMVIYTTMTDKQAADFKLRLPHMYIS